MNKPITLTAYAKHRGVTQQTASGYIKKGLIKEAIKKNGKAWVVDVAAADKLLDERLNKRKGPNAKKYTSEMTEADVEIKEVADASGVNDETFTEAQRIKINYEAGIKKLQYEKMIGELVEIKTVESTMFTAMRQVRDSFLNIPARVAVIIAAKVGGDAVEVEQLLNKEFRVTLEKIDKKWGKVE